MQVNNNAPVAPTRGANASASIDGAPASPQFNATPLDKEEVGTFTIKNPTQDLQDKGMPPPKDAAPSKPAVNNAFTGINWDQSDFTSATLMETLFEAAKKMRAAGMEARNTELGLQVNSLLGQVKDIKDAAAKTYSAALIQGWMSIGSGVVSGISSGVGLVKSYSAFKDLKEIKLNTGLQKDINALAKDPALNKNMQYQATSVSGELTDRIKYLGMRIDQSTGITQSVNAAGTSITSLAGGIGSVASAGQTKDAADLEAEGKRKEADATKISAELQKTNEFTQNAKEQLKAIFDLIQATANAEKAVSDAIVRNMV